MSLIYQKFPFQLRELKEVDGTWTFSGYCSTFGNVDLGGDRIMPGAFDKTLAARPRRPLLWQHDIAEPIGREKSLVVDEHGLLGTWEIIPTTRGRDAYALLKAGAIDAMSIGYIAEEYKFDDDGTRDLLVLDLLENSVVTLGMNESALITAVKAATSRPFDVHADDVRVAVAEWLDRVRSGADIRTKEGRAISGARRTRMATVSGSLREAADEIDAMLTETAPPAKADDEPTEPKTVVGINVAYEMALRRSRLRGRVEIPA